MPLNVVVSFVTVIPAFVCMVIILKLLSLTPSMMSTSPALGHGAEVPSIQKAGHKPQVEEGM